MKEVFLTNPSRSKRFLISRNDIYAQTDSDLFEIRVSSPDVVRLPVFVQTLVQLFSSYSGFIFFDDLVSIMYHEAEAEGKMVFSLRFLARTFAILHEGSMRYWSYITFLELTTHRGVLNKEFPEVEIFTPLQLPKGTSPFLKQEDFVPVSPANGPTWSVRVFGQEIFLAHGLSEILEYFTYTTADEAVPTVSFVQRNIGHTAPVVKLSLTPRGLGSDMISAGIKMNVHHMFWYGFLKLLVLHTLNHFCILTDLARRDIRS